MTNGVQRPRPGRDMDATVVMDASPRMLERRVQEAGAFLRGRHRSIENATGTKERMRYGIQLSGTATWVSIGPILVFALTVTDPLSAASSISSGQVISLPA